MANCGGCGNQQDYIQQQICDCCLELENDNSLKDCILWPPKTLWLCVEKCAKIAGRRQQAFGEKLFE